MSYRVPLAMDTYGLLERMAALRVIESGRYTMGPEVREFESMCATEYDVAGAVMVNSGSSANLLAVAAAELPAGSEVIVPAVTWATTIWPVIQCGLVPVVVDVDASLTLDVRAVEAAFTERTSAIFAVHLLGNPTRAHWLAEFCLDRKLVLLEDACEAQDVLTDTGGFRGGITRKDRKCAGSIGRFGTFSFFFSHHISTMEGGMVLCQNAEDVWRVRSMRSHGMSRDAEPWRRGLMEEDNPGIDPRFLFVSEGWNLRPTEINGALGGVQMARRKEFNARRAAIFDRWHRVMESGVDWRPGFNPFGFPILCDTQQGRDALRAHLEASGIETRPIVAGNLTRQPCFRDRVRVPAPLPGANRIHDCGLYIGISPAFSEEQVAHVEATLAGVTA